MTQKLLLLCIAFVLILTVALAGGDKTTKTQDLQVQVDREEGAVSTTVMTPDPLGSNARPTIGTYTTLSGFYDWQSNGGAVQHIQVNPANGHIHVAYMLSEDSTSLSASRRSGYAYSSDDGVTWNNFNNVRVPARSSGYPCVTILKGATAGLPAIANHSTISGTQSTVFIDSPEGTGAFSELNAPPVVALSGTNQPIWPNVAGAADGSIVLSASINSGAAPYFNLRTRTTDFSSWSAWSQYPDTNNSGGRYPTYANDNGYVGTLLNAGNAGGAWWHQSTDNGATWSAHAQNIYPISPPGRTTQTDTFRIWVGNDFVWSGNTPYMTICEQSLTTGHNNRGQILFWSQATGIVVVADSANTPGSIWPLNRTQSNHLTIGWPVIGMTGNTLVIVYQAFTADTSASGFNFGDLYWTKSTNNGATWSAPVHLTNTPNLDERYPSISKWNPSGYVYLTWQEDTQPGSGAFTDLAPITRARQVFYKLPVPTTDVREGVPVANAFTLSQNYPNPFNPSTKIEYTVAQAGPVSIRVYDLLGREVATLLDDVVSAGQHEVVFDAKSLASGVYVYKMTTGGFTAAKRMILMK